MKNFSVYQHWTPITKENFKKLGFTFAEWEETSEDYSKLIDADIPRGWQVLGDAPFNSLADETGCIRGKLYEHFGCFNLELFPRFGVYTTEHGVTCFGQTEQKLVKGNYPFGRTFDYEASYTHLYIAGVVDKPNQEGTGDEAQQMVQNAARQLILEIHTKDALAWGKANFPNYKDVTAYRDLDIRSIEAIDFPPKPTWQTNIETGILQRAVELQQQAMQAIKTTGLGKSEKVKTALEAQKLV